MQPEGLRWDLGSSLDLFPWDNESSEGNWVSSFGCGAGSFAVHPDQLSIDYEWAGNTDAPLSVFVLHFVDLTLDARLVG